MNYWSALTTFPSNPEIQLSLFEYILKNWVSRGTETARLVYGIERGFVAHDEMNVSENFGAHTSSLSNGTADIRVYRNEAGGCSMG